MADENQNSLKDIKAYFQSEEKPLKSLEFKEFWDSLSDEEKDELKSVDLKEM